MTEDHLGTPRIITDGNGEVISRRDFMPFGEDIGSTVGTRSTSSFKYASNEDDVRQKFTGYQKDTETGLDFAEARMYENRHARFTAVDPLLASGQNADPQTFNRYAYVMNNPMLFTDPSGLCPEGECPQQFCINCQPTIHNESGNLVVFGGDQTVPDDYSPITTSRIFHGGSGRSYNLTATTVLPYVPPPSEERGMFIGCAGMTNVCLPNVAALPDTLTGWKNGALDIGRMTFNSPLETSISPIIPNSSIGDLIGYPRFFDYSPEPSSLAEKQAYYQSFGSLSIASFAVGGEASLTSRTSVFMKGKAFELKYLNRHLPNTRQSNKLANKGGAHIFNNLETLSDVESTIFSKGKYDGFIRGYHRYSLKFDKPIGIRIENGRSNVPLNVGELKIRENGFYHLVPRTKSAN